MSYHDDPPFDADAGDGGDDLFDSDLEPEEHQAGGSRRRRLRGRGQQADAEELLSRVADLIAAARPMPLSASAMINKEEVLELLQEALERLPDELREDRSLRKERDEYLAKVQVDGEELMEAARARAERMVQRTEVVKSAEHRARRIIDGAEAEARRLRLECEDYCDQKLAGFEIVLERTLKTVAGGRARLQATNTPRPDPEREVDEELADEVFFDQDRP